jgi:hypothetical protein
MCKTPSGIIAKKISTHFENKVYYQQSTNDVTLEVKVAKINK